jgi:hypothetical protein
MLTIEPRFFRYQIFTTTVCGAAVDPSSDHVFAVPHGDWHRLMDHCTDLARTGQKQPEELQRKRKCWLSFPHPPLLATAKPTLHPLKSGICTILPLFIPRTMTRILFDVTDICTSHTLKNKVLSLLLNVAAKLRHLQGVYTTIFKTH